MSTIVKVINCKRCHQRKPLRGRFIMFLVPKQMCADCYYVQPMLLEMDTFIDK